MKPLQSNQQEQHGLSRAQLDELLDDLVAYAGRIRGFRKIKRKVEDNGIVHISGEIILKGLGDFRFMIIPFLKHEKFWTIHLENAHTSLESGNTVYTAYHFPHLARNPDLKQRITVANWVIGQLTNNTGFSLPGKTVQEMRRELDFLGIPPTLRSRERVLESVQLIREANLPKPTDRRFEKN